MKSWLKGVSDWVILGVNVRLCCCAAHGSLFSEGVVEGTLGQEKSCA